MLLQVAMVCPVCVATAVSQAAIPVASAVGGAVAARAALMEKKKAQRGDAISIGTVKSSDAKLCAFPVEVKLEKPSSGPSA